MAGKETHTQTVNSGIRTERAGSERGCLFTPVNRQLSPELVEALREETVTISVRVPLKYKAMYRRFTHEQRYMFKLGVMALIESLSRSESKIQQGPVILNINMNIQKNEQKVGSVDVDPALLLERLKVLKEEVGELKEILKYYKEKEGRLKEKLRRVKSLSLKAKQALNVRDVVTARKLIDAILSVTSSSTE